MPFAMSLSKTALRLVALGIMAGGVPLGAVLLQRGPELDPLLQPAMAEKPIIMPDGRSLMVQRHEVTVAQYNTCAEAGACELSLRVRAGHDPATTPATGLSYVDAQQYITWLNARTGQSYRMPTSAEWNLMAASVLPEEPDPIFTDPALSWASSYLTEGNAPRTLRAQGSFSTSPEGIADLDGSVWEWTSDCYADNISAESCPAFFVGGEHVAAMSYLIRDPARGGCAVGSPPAHLGMRLVMDDLL